MTQQETEKATTNSTDSVKIVAYLLVGFCLLLTLRVGLNGALFCMRRFKIPDYLYSLYVSRVHNCIELSGFLGVVIGTFYNFKYTSNNGQEKSGGQSDPLHKEKVSIGVNWLFFSINVVLLLVFVTGGELGHLTDFYWTLALSAMIYGLNLQFTVNLEGDYIVYFFATLHTSGIFASVFHFIMSKIIGNRRKYDTDFNIITSQIIVSIIISGVSAGVWTSIYKSGIQNNTNNNGGVANGKNGNGTSDQKCTSTGSEAQVISPMLMCITGQGLVYVFYPAIAPGMLVSSVHVQKIDQALLILAPLPSIGIAFLSHLKDDYSPKCKWSGGVKPAWHCTHLFGIIMIICGILFFKSLHYPSSGTARSIVNKPGVTGFLTILFYVSHMILLAVGYPGVEKNSPTAIKDYLAPINVFLTTGTMILLVFCGEGYITEFKKYQRDGWPTIGMTNKRAFSFWVDKAWTNAFKNFLLVFTRDLRKDLLTALDKD